MYILSRVFCFIDRTEEKDHTAYLYIFVLLFILKSYSQIKRKQNSDG